MRKIFQWLVFRHVGTSMSPETVCCFDLLSLLKLMYNLFCMIKVQKKNYTILISGKLFFVLAYELHFTVWYQLWWPWLSFMLTGLEEIEMLSHMFITLSINPNLIWIAVELFLFVEAHWWSRETTSLLQFDLHSWSQKTRYCVYIFYYLLSQSRSNLNAVISSDFEQAHSWSRQTTSLWWIGILNQQAIYKNSKYLCTFIYFWANFFFKMEIFVFTGGLNSLMSLRVCFVSHVH